jgi:hypothetical protein
MKTAARAPFPMTTTYQDSMTLADARAAFFAASHLGPDGGYGARWVRVESRPIPFYFPNTACRVAAAKLHDLHHVATGYGVDWPGEAEIAAWEIASGCGRYGWAWILNLGAFTIGLFLSPRRTFRAFVRGRRATTNLYHAGFAETQLADVTVGALRRQVGVGAVDASAKANDSVYFALWVAVGLGWYLAFAAAVIGIAALIVREIALRV